MFRMIIRKTKIESSIVLLPSSTFSSVTHYSAQGVTIGVTGISSQNPANSLLSRMVTYHLAAEKSLLGTEAEQKKKAQ